MLHGKECALGFSREKELIGYIERFSMRDWLTGLWRLRSPTVCHRQAKDLGKPVVRFQFKLGPGNMGVGVGWQECEPWLASEGLRTRSVDV